MIVYGFPVGLLQANCYLVGDSQTRHAAVIDPGDEYQRILNECTKRQLAIKTILLTHAHPDHLGAMPKLLEVTGAKLCCHRDEIPVLQQILQMRGSKGASVESLVDQKLQDGEEIQVGNLKIRVIHTPGHSPGGACYLIPPCLFTGDTLFMGSIGRTDIPGGDHRVLLQSIATKLLPLGDDLIVLPGHMGKSTLKEEKQSNPFIRRIIGRG